MPKKRIIQTNEIDFLSLKGRSIVPKKRIVKPNEIDFLSLKGRSVVSLNKEDRKHTRTHFLEGAIPYVSKVVSIKKQS